MFSSLSKLVAVLATVTSLASSHIVITYPGQRGNNLHTNGTVGLNDYQTGYFPYGMQWMYPCGGMSVTTNRTKWPIHGGAINFQPGWFQGHQTGLIYVNLGLGTIPPNYSHPMNPVFGIIGPRNTAYPGKNICLPQVGLPANLTINPGDNATIQVVLAAKHGAALYSCVDITFTDNMTEVEEVTEENCKNDTDSIQFTLVFATTSLSKALLSFSSPTLWSLISLAGAVTLGGWLL